MLSGEVKGMKIVIASDSFKGSLSSMEVADAVEAGILKSMPDAEIIKLPVEIGRASCRERV